LGHHVAVTPILRPDDFRDLAAPLVIDANVGGAMRALELAVRSVSPLPPHRLRAEPFSLVLAGPAQPLLPQASYTVRHPVLGPVELFLVPIGRDASSVEYEVTFN
jgi:uncharacterized protein DUF6916